MKHILKKALIFVLVFSIGALSGCGGAKTPETAVGEKVNISVLREGETELLEAEVIAGNVVDYTMAVCLDYFSPFFVETVDIYSYENWPGEENVYFGVSAFEGDKSTFKEGMKTQYANSFESVSFEKTKIAGYKATAAYLNGDKEHPGYNTTVFLVEGETTSLIIDVRYAAEMAEGLYQIIMSCLNTLVIK